MGDDDADAATTAAFGVTLIMVTSEVGSTVPVVSGSMRRAMAEEKPWAKANDDDWYCDPVMPERVVVVCTRATANVMSPLVGLGGLATYLSYNKKTGDM